MISISQTSVLLGVSQATIRNWIKSGDLQLASRGKVSLDSLNTFRESAIGHSRLVSRANKQHKVEGSDNTNYSPEKWQDYENSLDESTRNKEGIYYTPEHIIQKMLSTIDAEEIDTKSFLDPCCGGGNFIIEAIKKGIRPCNIFGFDTDKNAVEITKYRIEQLTGYKSANIICGDFLDLSKGIEQRYDYIFTNPPWGKKLPRAERERFAKLFSTSKSVDSSTLFMLASLDILAPNGVIGFLVQGAIFNIANHQELRSKLLTYKITNFIDFGQAFKPLMTKAHAVILQNKLSDDSAILCESQNDCFQRSIKSFKDNPNYIFNIWSNPQSEEVITHLQNIKHITLRGEAKWGLGIVTGNNKRFCQKSHANNYIEVFRGEDVTPDGFKKASMYLHKDMSHYQQVAPAELWCANCKVVYKFITSKLTFVCDREQRYFLNSANFFILNDTFPVGVEQLIDLLNSDFMNWYFTEIFNTQKILRADLESLPIFINYFSDGRKFNEDEYLEYLGIERVEPNGYTLSPNNNNSKRSSSVHSLR